MGATIRAWRIIMAGKFSAQELKIIANIEEGVRYLLSTRNNPYHIAMALGRVRWDLLTITNRELRHKPGILPEEITNSVYDKWL